MSDTDIKILELVSSTKRLLSCHFQSLSRPFCFCLWRGGNMGGNVRLGEDVGGDVPPSRFTRT